MTVPHPTNNIAWAPGDPLPMNADRATLARIISHHCFPVAARTLRKWPLVAIRPNKRVVYRVEDALEYAHERLKSAPTYKQ